MHCPMLSFKQLPRVGIRAHLTDEETEAYREPLVLAAPTAISLWVKPDLEKASVSTVPAWPLAESPALGAL